ncbi:hypothetical protein EMMF5_002741 [Cystobasidiomycetes sp. EMM_F5]
MPHWTDRYATGYHAWRVRESDNAATPACFYRPQGMVEQGFHSDGAYYEGRADINVLLEVDISSRLTKEQLRKRILLCWTILRLNHVLLLAKSDSRQDGWMQPGDPAGGYFIVETPQSVDAAIRDAKTHLVYASDDYEGIDTMDLFRHTQNCARIIDPRITCSKLFVVMRRENTSSSTRVSFLMVIAHECSDGLAATSWLIDFLKLLNSSSAELKDGVNSACTSQAINARLPPAQEDLYPPLAPSVRARWSWAISRVLRHVHHNMPAAFPNPLRRDTPFAQAVGMVRRYPKLVNYDKTPPLNGFVVKARLSLAASKRLQKLCKETGVSVGAGCFVLVGMVMMLLHERRYPAESDDPRKPFIGSFPINPRPFFNHLEVPDSCMLAFSEGVVLPFLPASLDFDKRFRLLVRQAHRQLARYQRRAPSQDDVDMKSYMGSSGAGRVISMNYLMMTERIISKVPESERAALSMYEVQGKYPASKPPGLATCGISSVGKTPIRASQYSLDLDDLVGEDAFRAKPSHTVLTVRPRDGEFLCAIWGEEDGCIASSVSFDGNAIDEERALIWKETMETIMEPSHEPSVHL